MRREERVTVQGPVKEQQPDGMSHRGGGGGRGTRQFGYVPSGLRGYRRVQVVAVQWRGGGGIRSVGLAHIRQCDGRPPRPPPTSTATVTSQHDPVQIASDGVWDNVYDAELIGMISEAFPHGYARV